MKYTKPFRLAIFASGSGTNAQKLIDHFFHHQAIQVSLLLSNNPRAYAIQRAAKAGIATKVFNKAQWQGDEVLLWLSENNISHLVLAGFLWLVPKNLIEVYPDKIINLHPALLPKYGGKGMYGHKVHEAVKAAGEHETGITIHLVNEKYDEGAILFQAKTSIEPTDDVQKIAEKVHQLEYEHYPRVVEGWVLKAGLGIG